jgi:hypothetical protein
MASTKRIAGLFGATESHQPALMMSALMAAPLVAPASWDGRHGIGDSDWGMDLNNRYGCCGAAAVDHGEMAKSGNAALYGTLGQPTYPGTIQTYFAYGLAMGEVGQPPNAPTEPDQGVMNSTWCGWLYEQGIIDGYGEVPLDEVHAFSAAFGGVLLGIHCGADFQDLFARVAPWGSTSSPPEPTMGHDIYLCDYAADGSGGVITWGHRQPITASFISTYVTDAWVFFDKDTDPLVDQAAMKDALNSIHGTVRAA